MERLFMFDPDQSSGEYYVNYIDDDIIKAIDIAVPYTDFEEATSSDYEYGLNNMWLGLFDVLGADFFKFEEVLYHFGFTEHKENL